MTSCTKSSKPIGISISVGNLTHDPPHPVFAEAQLRGDSTRGDFHGKIRNFPPFCTVTGNTTLTMAPPDVVCADILIELCGEYCDTDGAGQPFSEA